MAPEAKDHCFLWHKVEPFLVMGLLKSTAPAAHYYLCGTTVPLPEKASFATDATVSVTLRHWDFSISQGHVLPYKRVN